MASRQQGRGTAGRYGSGGGAGGSGRSGAGTASGASTATPSDTARTRTGTGRGRGHTRAATGGRPDWLTGPQAFLLPLRLFLGVTFVFAGLQKLADPLFLRASNPTSLPAQLALVRPSSPIGWALGPVTAHPTFFGVVIALAEVAVGLGTLLGLFTRVAAAGGLVLALSFWLTISWHTRPYYYGSDIVFAVTWLTLLLAGPVAPAADLLLARASSASLGLPPDPSRYARPEAARFQREYTRRRSLLAGLAGLGALAVAGVTSWLGRAMSGNRTGVAAVLGPTASGAASAPADTASPPASASASTAASGSASPSPSAGAPSAAAPHPPSAGASSSAPSAAATPSGSPLAPLSTVPVGGAAVVSDATGAPLILLRPTSSQVRAFSAICTHAGCTVGFQNGVILCPCHGGEYSPTTGAVVAGPPPAPLAAVKVKVVNGQVYSA